MKQVTVGDVTILTPENETDRERLRSTKDIDRGMESRFPARQSLDKKGMRSPEEPDTAKS